MNGTDELGMMESYKKEKRERRVNELKSPEAVNPELGGSPLLCLYGDGSIGCNQDVLSSVLHFLPLLSMNLLALQIIFFWDNIDVTWSHIKYVSHVMTPFDRAVWLLAIIGMEEHEGYMKAADSADCVTDGIESNTTIQNHVLQPSWTSRAMFEMLSIVSWRFACLQTH